MEQTVSKDVLDVFAYGFFVMCLVTAVFLAFRIRLQSDRLTVRERISAHRWCIGTVIPIATYFVSLGMVTGELPTLYLGFLLPAAFVLFDFRALRNLRILEGAATAAEREIEAEVAKFRN